MAINRDILREEIQEQWEEWRSYKIYADGTIGFFGPDTDSLYEIYNNEDYKNLYDREDYEQILEEYILKIKEICSLVLNPQKSDRENILNILEYMRYMHSFENIPKKKIEILRPGVLSQTPFIQAFLGKGVCASQAKLLRDILPSNLNPEVLTVNFFLDDDIIDDKHDVVIASIDGEECYIDPTWYTGEGKSLEGSKNKASYKNRIFKSIEASEEEIMEARKEIQNKLIKKLKIDKISQEIIDPEMTDLEKQCAIFMFIDSRINHFNNPVDFATAKLFAKNIEVGKLMELFFVANGIEHEMDFYGKKSNAIYNVEYDGKKASLLPKTMYDPSESGIKLSTKLYFNLDENGLIKYLAEDPAEFEKQRVAIIKGLEKVEGLDLSKLEQEDNLKDEQNTKKRDYFNDEVEL